MYCCHFRYNYITNTKGKMNYSQLCILVNVIFYFAYSSCLSVINKLSSCLQIEPKYISISFTQKLDYNSVSFGKSQNKRKVKITWCYRLKKGHPTQLAD